MPTPVYDDEKAKTGVDGSHDDLGVSDDQKKQEVADLESSFINPSINEEINSAKSPEESFSPKPEEDISDSTETNSFYKPSEKKVKVRQNFLGGNKKKQALVLSGPIILILLIAVILFLMSMLKIPNYAENIAAYRLARTASQFAKTSSRIETQKLKVSTIESDVVYKEKIYDKYSKMRGATWGKFDKYRPGLTYENMKADNKVKFNETTYKTKLGFERSKITSIVIGGEEIKLNEQKFGRILSNRNERIAFNAKLQANIDAALKSNDSIVRSKVAAKIRADLGIKLKFWDNKGKKYRGLKADEAQRLLLEESKEKITKSSSTPGITEDTKKSTDAVKKALDECITDEKCAQELIDGEDLPEKISKELNSSAAISNSKKIIGATSTAYAIAAPICMIYEGSIVNSSDDIDAANASSTASFYALASAADQQKAGDTSHEAVGAFNKKIGEGDSVPDQYMRGDTPDTSLETSPQTGGTGIYTIANTFIPNEQIANTVNSTASSQCPVFTSVAFGVGTAVVETAATAILSVFTGGGAAAGKEALKQGAVKGITQVVKTTTKRVGEAAIKTKTYSTAAKNIGTFGKRFGRDFVAIEGATVLAKLIVLSKSGLLEDGGTTHSTAFKNQVDKGANNHNNDLNRQMNYAAPMSSKNVEIDNGQIAAYLNKKEGTKPLSERYFAINNPKSITSKTIYKIATVRNQGINITKSFSTIIGNSLLIPTKALGIHRASAAEPLSEHYGIVQWGWTQEEEALKDTETYSILENALALDNSGQTEAIEQKYGTCFTDSMGTLLSNGDIKRNESGDVLEDDSRCSPKSLGPNNKDYGDLVFRWRIDKEYQNVLEQNTEIGTPTVGKNAEEQIIAEDNSNDICQAGTDKGVVDGWKDGEKYRIRVCSVQGIVVNASISANINKLMNDAKTAGLKLSGGGYRTNDQQIALRTKNGCPDVNISESSSCKTPTARPGYSNHQMGLAIDFTCSGKLITGSANSCFRWLDENAKEYGLINYKVEPWHWSVDGK